MADAALLGEIEKLRSAASQHMAKSQAASQLAAAKKADLAKLTERLVKEHGCQTWAEASELLAKLGKDADTATENARAQLVAEGIIPA